jgi:hypothetical protein
LNALEQLHVGANHESERAGLRAAGAPDTGASANGLRCRPAAAAMACTVAGSIVLESISPIKPISMTPPVSVKRSSY